MNLLDLLLIVILAVSVAAGFAAGFARAAIGFIAVLGGILCGFWFYGIPAGWLHRYITSTTVSNIFGFILVFFGFQLAGGLVGKIVAKLFKWTGLTFVDRILGAAFGFVRGTLAAVALVAVLMAFTPSPPPNWMVDSTLLPYAIDGSHLCASLAPRALTDAFRTSMNEIRTIWDEQVRKAREHVEQRDRGKSKSELKKIDQ